MLLLSFSALVVVAAAETIAVHSSTRCPATEQISASLLPLLPNGMRIGPGGDVASVDVAAGAGGEAELRLRLLRADGTVAGDRRLPVQEGCQKMADVVATVIAAWKIDPSDSVGPEPGPRPGPVADEPTPSLAVVLGASAGAALIGGVSATGSIEAAVGPAGSRWQLRLAGLAQSAREQSLAGGTVAWQHSTVAAGLRLASRGRWRFAVDAGPILGWASLAGHGDGNWQDGRQDVLEYGGGAGARVERWWGRIALWLELRTHVWAESQQATVVGEGESHVTLSRFDMMVSLGGSAAVLP